MLGEDRVTATDADLTLRNGGEAVGQRILVFGRVLDSDGRPVPDALVEVWQANAAGRYRHVVDNWPAPLDPHFDGLGRVVTDSLGRYEFMTIKPGAYPWGNHHNAWRPAHIHFSLFGRAFTQRLVTQMYFPDDPLFGQDPIYNAIPAAARPRTISRYSLERTQDNWALAFEWDIVLRGARPDAVRDRRRRRCRVTDRVNPLDVPADRPSPSSPSSGQRGSGFLTGPFRLGPTPSATVGPYLAIGLTWADGDFAAEEGTPGGIWIRGQVFDGPATSSPTRWWRPGRPTRTAASRRRRTRAGAASYPGFRGYARAQTIAGESGCTPSSPVGCPTGRAACRRRTSTCRCSPAGMLDRVVTRIYFADEAEANAEDVVLQSVPADRRDTLLATPDGDGYRFDVYLQGDRETSSSRYECPVIEDARMTGLFDGTFARGGAAARRVRRRVVRALLDVEAALARAAARRGAHPTTAADAVTRLLRTPAGWTSRRSSRRPRTPGTRCRRWCRRCRTPSAATPPAPCTWRDQPGRPRHRARCCSHANAIAAIDADLAAAARGRPARRRAPGRRRHGPHAAAAGAADDVRPQGGGLAGRPRGRPAPAGRGGGLAARPVRRRGRHAGRQLRLRRGAADGARRGAGPGRHRRPWHTVRLPIADLAGALGAAAGVVATVAVDVVLMAQTEVGEVSEGGAPGRLVGDAAQGQPGRGDLRPGLRAAGARPGRQRCSARWSRSTSGPPGPGTASGRR